MQNKRCELLQEKLMKKRWPDGQIVPEIRMAEDSKEKKWQKKSDGRQTRIKQGSISRGNKNS